MFHQQQSPITSPCITGDDKLAAVNPGFGRSRALSLPAQFKLLWLDFANSLIKQLELTELLTVTWASSVTSSPSADFAPYTEAWNNKEAPTYNKTRLIHSAALFQVAVIHTTNR